VTATIAQRVADVRSRIDAAAHAAARDPVDIRLVAACKTVPAERVIEGVRAGLTDLGENRAQELVAKAPAVADQVGPAPAPAWHFLGTLQRNKVRVLAPWVTCWHSVDRVQLAPALARHAPGARVLVEVNLAGEQQKGGCAPADAAALVDALRDEELDVVGLMTVPPHGDDPRPWFAMLRGLAERLGLEELSMGMSDDFELAIAEGATIVRVGRALFGPRDAA
jgi:pyridoxal phosphate enzyme (YggS family)